MDSLIDTDFRGCLQAHYGRNSHHPEHYSDPSEMSIESRMELTCDLLGTVMGWARKQGKVLSVPECRALIEKENWRHWNLALTDRLPPPSVNVPVLEPRWHTKHYSLTERIDLELSDEIDDLECVRDYLEDLRMHKSGVFRVWKEIVSKHDRGFVKIAERIQNHDLDKYRPDMVRAYTKQFSSFDDIKRAEKQKKNNLFGLDWENLNWWGITSKTLYFCIRVHLIVKLGTHLLGSPQYISGPEVFLFLLTTDALRTPSRAGDDAKAFRNGIFDVSANNAKDSSVKISPLVNL